jgi:hypothetical protein
LRSGTRRTGSRDPTPFEPECKVPVFVVITQNNCRQNYCSYRLSN